MAAFRFRLATLLKLRESERQRCRADLAEAFRADRVLLEEGERLSREIVVTKRAAEQASRGSVNVGRLLEMNRYELVLQTQQATLSQKRETMQEEIERRRDRLIEADRQVRVLENLRDRQSGEYQQAEMRQETKDLDEIAARNERRTSWET